MDSNILTPRQALSKAYLKQSIGNDAFNAFKTNLLSLLDKVDVDESEEHNKNFVADFLKITWYTPHHEINTKERNDLVIHIGKTTKDTVGVIIEAKKPSNKAEMITKDNLNAKALQELLLYYMKERVTHSNNDLKYLVVTNVHEWFIFDAQLFEKLFYNSSFKKDYEKWRDHQKTSNNTDHFYSEIAKPFIEKVKNQLRYTWFDMRDYRKDLGKTDKASELKLTGLYKVLSPQHLLKLSFANDSNSLNTRFYTELLHIMGLEEVKDGGKKVIQRKPEGKRDEGSLLENAITYIQDRDKLGNVDNLSSFGTNETEQLFSVGLEVCITWLNRVLFLKLLEAQLKRYHKGNPAYSFLNKEQVSDFDVLERLFFDVLAKLPNDRKGIAAKQFAHIPYLNSSLFEQTGLEKDVLQISNLKNDVPLPLHPQTVLVEGPKNKRLAGTKNTLHYLFEFLEAYNFSSDGTGEVQHDNKTLINASVLGLIFEKLNGYKDGSFFTPGFITMYMCRETLRRAVLQKFNETYGQDFDTFETLAVYTDKHFKPAEVLKHNAIVNSIKICDPAVGSGHFLVSALNELIAIKSELKILADKDGKPFGSWTVAVDNDELVIFDERNNELFEYHAPISGKTKSDNQRLQETLFAEKQTIIENCLFGVDINPNSVKICRLRLWIELLKNAYYTTDSEYTHLETLPNIDINIKKGNSLVSRFSLDEDLSKVLKSIKYTIEQYRGFVNDYKNERNRETKKGFEQIINSIKSDFKTQITQRDPTYIKLQKAQYELHLLVAPNLFKEDEAEYGNKDLKKKKAERIKKLEDEVTQLSVEINSIKNNAIYRNAFEWRFEFPEVLDNDGNFLGFDVVIGNPPYGVKPSIADKEYFSKTYLTQDDIYTSFFEKGSKIINEKGLLGYINPVTWQTGDNYINTRTFIKNNSQLLTGIVLPYDVFADAYVDTGIYIFAKNKDVQFYSSVYEFNPRDKINIDSLNSLKFDKIYNDSWQNTKVLKIRFNLGVQLLLSKLSSIDNKIENLTDSVRGILASDEDVSSNKIDEKYRPLLIGKMNRYSLEKDFLFVKYGDNLKEKPKSYKFFNEERILVRRIVNRQFRVMATMTKEEFVTKKDFYIFKLTNKSYSYQYLLAVINSTLISFLKTKASTAAKKDDFTQLTLSDIREIPIPEISVDGNKKIITLVDKILSTKQANPQADTTALELKIDQLVYQLYNLTSEEIKIVEGA